MLFFTVSGRSKKRIYTYQYSNPLLNCLMEQSIYGKERDMNNEFQFTIYNPILEKIYVIIDANIILSIDCRKCNSNVFTVTLYL